MAAIDKLVIEIDGNASGLTKALAQAQKNLTSFNTNISAGNKALNTLVSNFNKAAGSAQRLATTVNEIKSSFTGLNRSINSSSAAINRLGASARTASSDLKTFSANMSRIASSFERLNGASKGVTAAINSLQRRVAALGTTVSATNSNMRNFNRTVQMATDGASRGGVVVNNYGRAVSNVGRAANTSAGLFTRLNKANITLMEGFRRHVAQITALRTLVYQGIFWFSPLVYSIIKVNAQYEKQIQLLKNLSGQTTEAAKMQWALQMRQALVTLANTNPFSLDQITETFVRLKVSGIDPLNGSMQALMDSIAAFGGGNDELQRAAIAIQQMVGKSAVSMEELRQQLGEHIPDAMSAMARGMGLSMADFYKAVQKGTVESTTAIAKMLAVLNAQHRGSAAAMMNTWNGLMARLGTAWQNFIAKMEHSEGRNTFIDTLKEKVQELMVFLNSPAGVNLFISIEQGLANVVKAVTNLIKFIYDWRDVIIDAAKVFAVLWGGKLVLGTILSVVRAFGSGLRAIILVLGLFTNSAGAAALMTAKLGGAVRTLAVALGIAKTEAEAASIGIGSIAARMAGAIGIALALAGAVWAVVKALNAQTLAQQNAALAKRAAEGRTWDVDANGNSPERDAKRQQLTDLKNKIKAGGEYVQIGEGTPVWQQYTPAQMGRMKSDLQKGVNAFNVMQANTRNANVSMVNTQFEQSQPDPYASVRAKYNNMEVNVTDGKQLNQIEQQKSLALADAAKADIHRLQSMKNGASPAQQAAIDALIDKRTGDYNSFVAGQQVEAEPNKFIANKKGAKKKKTPKDPLEGARSGFVESVVSTADLQHQYDDLVHRTSTEFDPEAARAEGERRASLLKTKEALQLAKDQEKARQEEIRKSIKVEQAIIDVQDEATKTTEKTAEQVDFLRTNYDSITLEVSHYQNELERSHRTELDIAEARINSAKATKDELRQYVALRDAINAAVRAKEAELVVDAAKDAKAANEDYFASFRSPIQQADYQANIEYKKYSEVLKIAQDLASNEKHIDDDLAEAKARLAARTKELTDAGQAANEVEQDSIVITASRTVADDEAAKAAIAALPYLQQRLDILKQEYDIRHKFGGMGGPLLDWANKAAQDFQDLGASMGTVLTGAMDDFITSLGEGKNAFADFTKTIIKQLLLIIIRGLIAKAILSALGFAFGGGGEIAGTGLGDMYTGAGLDVGAYGLHSGGIAGGTPTFRRNVDPGIFQFAQRYHTGGLVSGLRPDEVPIIAQKGEGVFTKEQMAAMGQSKPNNIEINIINESGQPVDAEHKGGKFDGEKYIETVILKKMVTPGPVRDALRTQVGRR